MDRFHHISHRTRLTAALVVFGAIALGAVAQTPAAAPVPPKPAWEQSASLGFSLTKGNTDNLLFTADYRAARKVKQTEIAVGLDASYGEDSGKKNNEQFRIFGQYNWLFNERFYAYARAEGLHDDIADVQYRITLSLGAGYYFIKSGKTILSAEIGPGYTFERRGGDDRDYASLRVAEKYEHKFNDKTRVWQTLELLPQVTDFSNYILTFEVGLETALTDKISLRLTIRDIYDSDPAPGRKENDFRFVTGVAVKF